MFKKHVFPLAILIVYGSLILIPIHSNAEINVPPCEKLKNFPLHKVGSIIAYKEYDPILQEYFGMPLPSWSENDFVTFISAFVSCREKDETFFKNYSKNHFPLAIKREADKLKNELHEYSIKLHAKEDVKKLQKDVTLLAEKVKDLTISESDLARLRQIRIEAQELWKKHNYKGDFTSVQSMVDNALLQYERLKQDRKLQEELSGQRTEQEEQRHKLLAKQASESQELLKKHGKLGPPTDLLISQFQTYAGATNSGNMGTVIKLYDRLDGKKRWDKKGTVWVLTQNRKDNITSEKHEIFYAFHDFRIEKGYVWLERVIIDQQNYPPSQLCHLITQVMGQ